MASIIKKLFSPNFEGKKKSPSLIKTLLSNPDNFKFEFWVENQQLILKVTKKEDTYGREN